MKRHQKIIAAMVSITFLIFAGIALRPIKANGQTKQSITLSQEAGRDPFLLPPGVYLLSKIGSPQGMNAVSSKTETDAPLKAILIGDRIRLALMDRHIVTVGESIHGEKVLEIRSDRVVLGKGEQKRSLFLPQSHVLLTVEEKPHPSPPPQKGERAPLEIPVGATRDRAVNQTLPEGSDLAAEPFDPALRGTHGPKVIEGQPDVISNEVKEGVKGEER